MGWFEEKTPYLTAGNQLSVDVPLCPRRTLARVVQSVFSNTLFFFFRLTLIRSRQALDADVEFLVGFECEFILLKSTNPIQPSSFHHRIIPTGSVDSQILREIADGIQESGIELQVYHAESAPGQVNITVIDDQDSDNPGGYLVRDGHRSIISIRCSRRARPYQGDHLPHRHQTRITRHLCSEGFQELQRQLHPRSHLCPFKEDHQRTR